MQCDTIVGSTSSSEDSDSGRSTPEPTDEILTERDLMYGYDTSSSAGLGSGLAGSGCSTPEPIEDNLMERKLVSGYLFIHEFTFLLYTHIGSYS